MNPYNESKLEGISDADLIAQTSMQYKAVSHLCASLKSVHDQTVEFVPNQSRMMLKMQCVRTAEIMMMLGDILNNMDAVDAEEDGWMAPIFNNANRIFGENVKAHASLPSGDAQTPTSVEIPPPPALEAGQGLCDAPCSGSSFSLADGLMRGFEKTMEEVRRVIALKAAEIRNSAISLD